jgi:hypothetical protein
VRAHILFLTLLAGCLTGAVAGEGGPKFRADDPLWDDPDDLPSPLPEARRIPQLWDFIENTFLTRPQEGVEPLPAENANTVGGVPSSSWFVNRMGVRRLTARQVVAEHHRSGGPDLSRPLRIIAAKTQGITPGFTVQDARGAVYFVKFDPPRHPQLATSAEVIATHFFYAFGYRVPENYLAMIRREDLEISPDARLQDEEGKERAFTETDLNRILGRVYRAPDGRTPVVASLRLEGKSLGPFEYYGTRSDDPNDIIRHENRRELRGMRLFAAWLNHDDSRSINTLDMFVGEPGQGHVRHHLIDFGSCLGSGSTQVQGERAGNEYILEWGPILKAAVTLGIWDRKWRHVRYPDYPSIGRFEADFFQPELWRPEYPNPAFDRMTPQDAYWAARIISRFDDQMVRELVETGELWDKQAEEYLVRTLIRRRDKIVAHYLPQVCPLDDFGVTDGGRVLRFEDLAVAAGVGTPSPVGYVWFRFDNVTGRVEALGVQGVSEDSSVAVPDDPAQFLMVELEKRSTAQKLQVYLCRAAGGPEVVGVER